MPIGLIFSNFFVLIYFYLFIYFFAFLLLHLLKSSMLASIGGSRLYEGIKFVCSKKKKEEVME